MARRRGIHQFVVGASPGDAIYDQALLFQRALQGWGYESDLYACHMHPSLEGQVPHFSRYRSHSGDVAIFHYSIGSELSDYMLQLKTPMMMIYHNVTPAEYLEGVSHEMARLVRKGQKELPAFTKKAKIALADSEFNRLDLVTAGYPRTGVLPLALNESKYAVQPNPSLLERFSDTTNLLFVGRVAPNKRLEEVLKVFYYYHHIRPDSRLFFVGQAWGPASQYLEWLHSMTESLGLAEDVHFTGHVEFRDMVSYYRLAHLFLCMSDHEGFGKPLIESMHFGVPIVAYASTAIPYTLGDAGVLVHVRDYPLLAELIDVILTDEGLRNTIVATQQRRFEAFREKTVLDQFHTHLKREFLDA